MSTPFCSSSPRQSRPRPTFVRHGVLGCLLLAAAIAYSQRQLMSVVAVPIGSDLDLTEQQLGSVMASFFLGYALCQIPLGWLGDRWGSRKTLALSAGLWSVAVGMVALANSYRSLGLLWFIAGSAQAGIFSCATSSVRRWLPTTRRAFASGMLASAMSLGGALSAFLAGKLLGSWEWKTLFLFYSAPGLAWAAGWWFWFRDSPAEHRGVNEAERRYIAGETWSSEPMEHRQQETSATPSPAPVPWGEMLTSGSMWAICAQQFCRAAAYIFFATWFPSYLVKGRGVSLESAGEWTSLTLVAVVIGSPLGGIASDWLLRRTGSRRLSRCVLSAVSMGCCAALIVGAYFVEDARLAVLVISAGSFFAAFGGVSAYTITMDMGGRHVATVFSVMNMCGNLGAAFSPSVIGWLVEKTGRWDQVLLVFAIIYGAAAISWMLVNPRRAIFKDTPEPVLREA